MGYVAFDQPKILLHTDYARFIPVKGISLMTKLLWMYEKPDFRRSVYLFHLNSSGGDGLISSQGKHTTKWRATCFGNM